VPQSISNAWLALAIGNSRLHWAWFVDDTLQHTWHTHHVGAETIAELIADPLSWQRQGLWPTDVRVPDPFPPDLWLSSVVPQQTDDWQQYPQVQVVTLAQVPIDNLYPTLGIDRAIALWGALITYGSPVLVIDGGTALTLTAAAHNRLMGGAILPGLQLQFRSLGQSTAALPTLNPAAIGQLPSRWARDTPTAIASGILYTVVAGIQGFITDWLQQFPTSAIVFTGGDGAVLAQWCQQTAPQPLAILVDENLMFWGLRSIRSRSRPDRSQTVVDPPAFLKDSELFFIDYSS
jgi:type III pantothenate kinase